jgi:sodium-dependent dicarboxylate transporter 2/3/5
MSTPPNAIVFARGHLTMMQMVRAGVLLNLTAILLVAIFVKTIFPYLYEP